MFEPASRSKGKGATALLSHDAAPVASMSWAAESIY
jgi:hypothetical protein